MTRVRPLLRPILTAHPSPPPLLRPRHYSTSPTPLTLRTIPAPHTGHISILSLSLPSTRNAISRALLSALRTTLSTIRNTPPPNPTRALIIHSAVPGTFCAGADLKERRTFTPTQTHSFLHDLRSAFSELENLPIPTIAAVQGLALGGGLELALSAHLRIFSSLSTVALPETRLGIIPGAGGTYRLPALIGLARARELILTGRRVSGAEAYFLGICERLAEVPEKATGEEEAEKVLEAAVSLARDICEGAPLAVGAALEAVQGWRDAGVTEGMKYGDVVGTADRDEALKAFAEKRRPRFEGR
ncbi:MAG: hypothetical protein M1824_002422 [Vezdaea acicularis]|nr:MAG: hypothetical protein M1824_002422 [Vezdaea acicularis]